MKTLRNLAILLLAGGCTYNDPFAGARVYTDPKTGCEYLITQNDIIPRMEPAGPNAERQICSSR